MALTDTEIKRAKGADTPYRLADAGGLFVWVTPSGGKLWRWKYRFDGKQKLMTFGKYPDVPRLPVSAIRRALLACGPPPKTPGPE